jgi:hypothetical protein
MASHQQTHGNRSCELTSAPFGNPCCSTLHDRKKKKKKTTKKVRKKVRKMEKERKIKLAK